MIAIKDHEYTQEHVINVLQGYVDKYPNRAEAAEALGVNRVFLWRVLKGTQQPSASMLEKIGYTKERKITYVYKRV